MPQHTNMWQSPTIYGAQPKSAAYPTHCTPEGIPTSFLLLPVSFCGGLPLSHFIHVSPFPLAFDHLSCCIAIPSSWLKIPAELFQLNSATCTFVEVCSLYHAFRLKACLPEAWCDAAPPPSLLPSYLITWILRLPSLHREPFRECIIMTYLLRISATQTL